MDKWIMEQMLERIELRMNHLEEDKKYWEGSKENNADKASIRFADGIISSRSHELDFLHSLLKQAGEFSAAPPIR